MTPRTWAAVITLLAATAGAAPAPLDCPAPKGVSDEAATAGNPAARAAAQKALDFLSRETISWQTSNSCYGCHVQSQTLQAMAIGRQNRYDVRAQDLDAVVNGVLRLDGGARTPNGFSYRGTSLLQPARAFGGLALARYDSWIGSQLRDDLHKTGKQLLEYQRPDGSIALEYAHGVVSTGDLQGTWMAMQTWRQLHSRTADDAWFTPLQRAEAWVKRTVDGWKTLNATATQDLDYGLLALLAAGSNRSDASAARIVEALRARQLESGAWSLAATGAASALATGQALFALRSAGFTERDGAVARGTAWLVKSQHADGGWSSAGSAKAEALWAIQGLVAIDVLTVDIAGLEDGQHVEGIVQFGASARDNGKSGVRSIEILVDDVALTRGCGSKLSAEWDVAKLKPGRHLVDVIATNGAGASSRRQLEVFSGAVYVTQLGSTSERGTSTITLRHVGPAHRPGSVRVVIKEGAKKDGKPGREVFRLERPGAPGPMAFAWNGRDGKDRVMKGGRYVARVEAYEGKEVLQTEELHFFHGSVEEQRATMAEVQGSLSLQDGRGSANTRVELVDDDGRVVQSSVTTGTGQYRFKNVDAGKYKVRVRKDGFAAAELPVDAAQGREATPAAAPVMLRAE